MAVEQNLPAFTLELERETEILCEFCFSSRVWATLCSSGDEVGWRHLGCSVPGKKYRSWAGRGRGSAPGLSGSTNGGSRYWSLLMMQKAESDYSFTWCILTSQDKKDLVHVWKQLKDDFQVILDYSFKGLSLEFNKSLLLSSLKPGNYLWIPS